MPDTPPIPEDTLSRFAMCVNDSTYWNEAELNPRQAKHIAAVLAPEVAEWAVEEYQYSLRERMDQFLQNAIAEREPEPYLRALFQVKSLLKERPKETPVAD